MNRNHLVTSPTNAATLTTSRLATELATVVKDKNKTGIVESKKLANDIKNEQQAELFKHLTNTVNNILDNESWILDKTVEL